ncbi:MAG TPA: hypothetical protein VLF94_08660, partial [Chlamydiales bacterium]|nr:hypothetical protein [Chlamydiales bacterium]
FYTGIEPVNPNIRPGKDNVPHKIHAFVADYDTKIPDERIDEAIASMKHKPSWVERSLGGNARLVWLLAQPLVVDDYSFCAYILDAAVKWLELDLLPALDEQAFLSPSRLLCNGCEWRSTGHGPVSQVELQAFFIAAGKKYRFKSANETDIPLEIVEAELKKKFPAFEWPGEFALESQGPSFWIPESTSPQSAIVKQTGMFSFSAHATKAFYTWADILGNEVVKQFTNTSLAKATDGVYWDGKRFWRQIGGRWVSLGGEEMTNYLKVDCNLSSRALKGAASPVDVALSHVYNHNRIRGAVPFVFRDPGPIEFMGERVLNTYVNRAIQPAAGKQTWGGHGEFPFFSLLHDSVFDPVEQLIHFLAWWQYYYSAAFYRTPLPGQNIFLLGVAGCGKTLLNRHGVGVSVGGFVDASSFLIDGAMFNSHLMFNPHWVLDDDTPNNSSHASAKLQATFKKIAANQQMLFNEKFERAVMGEWMGRIGVTANLDPVSTRIIGPLDSSSLDKACLFRCVKTHRMTFPARLELAKILVRELPYFLRWLLDWKVPDHVERDPRYGYKAFHEPSLLIQSHHNNPMAPFKELLMDTLDDWFRSNEEAPAWTGTVSQLIRVIMSNPLNEYVMRSIKLEQANRYLEQIQKEGVMACSTDPGPLNTRIWRFPRPAALPKNGSNGVIHQPTQAAIETVSIFC